MRIGFTGTGYGMSELQLDRLRAWILAQQLDDGITFHHGDCIGADYQFHRLVTSLFSEQHVRIHPPINPVKRAWCSVPPANRYPAAEYLARDRAIVDCTDVLLVAPRTLKEELRSGTWYTYRYAVKRNKPHHIFYP